MIYTKLFSEIIMSTIWREPDHVRIVWITMLALKNKRHIVTASLPNLADISKVSIEHCKQAIVVLSSPDEYSKSAENEGRRIEECDGGWRILNGEKYTTKLKEDERREYQRVKQKEYRKKSGQIIDERLQNRVHSFTDVDNSLQPSTILTSTKNKKKEPNPLNSQTWEAYSTAYKNRYQVEPVRNAKVNGMIARLVERIGQDAPDVAAYYAWNNSAFYVRSGHSIDLLLKDCEKLRTEWVTGNTVTETKARQMDRSQSNFDVAQALIQEFNAK